MSTLHTTGQLRAMLASAIVDLREGRIDPKRAYTIAKLADGINNSILAEIAIAKIKIDTGHGDGVIGQMGQVPIFDASAPLALRPPKKALRSNEEPDPEET